MRFDRELLGIWAVALAALGFYAVLTAWYQVLPSTDMIGRYAPMADHFARGEWQSAFHPRFCCLFPLLTGLVVRLTGVSGDRACQLVALALWCFAAVPLWALVRTLSGRLAAALAALLMLTNIDLWCLAAEGWREPCRILPTLLIVLGFVRTFGAERERAWIGGLWMGLGMLLTVTLKIDAFVVSSLFLFAFVAWGCRQRRFGAAGIAFGGWLLGVLAESWLVYAYTGWFLPVVRLVPYAERFL